jgi:hypothetical protein
MTYNQSQNLPDMLGKLKDMLIRVDPNTNPFLYYLPELLTQKQFSQIDPRHVVTFVELTLKFDKNPLVKDAILILNRLVDPIDGSLIVPSREIFYENRSFFWDELGNHTQASDVISHIFNKVIFFSNIGKS